MDRVTELTFAYVDGDLTPDQAEELTRLISDDPRGKRTFLQIMDQEAACLGLRAGVNTADRVMGQIHAEIETRIVGNVMQKVKADGNGSARREWWALLDGRVHRAKALAVAAAVIALAGAYWLMRAPSIVTCSGEKLVLRYQGENTRVEVSENTRIRIDRNSRVLRNGNGEAEVRGGPRKVLGLEKGSIRAIVAKQEKDASFTVKGPGETIRVAGTVFSVRVDERDTRVSVEEGRVEMSIPGTGAMRTIPQGKDAISKAREGRIIMPGKFVKELSLYSLGLTDAPGVAFDGKHLWWWSVDAKGGESETMPAVLLKVDPATLKVIGRVTPEGDFYRRSPISYDRGWVWIWGAENGKNFLAAVDAETGATRQRVRLAEGVGGLTAFDVRDGVAWMWRKTHEEGCVRVNLFNGEVVGTVPVSPGWDVGRIACTPDGFYLGERYGYRVVKVSSAGEITERVMLDWKKFYGGDMAYDPTRGLWVSAWGNVHLFEAE